MLQLLSAVQLPFWLLASFISLKHSTMSRLSREKHCTALWLVALYGICNAIYSHTRSCMLAIHCSNNRVRHSPIGT
jgi:hypothetical protein